MIAARRRTPLTLALALALAAILAGGAHAGTPTWQFAPALAPAPPTGAAPAPYPVALGPVGDIRFWSPNRGVLITAGTGTQGIVPMGVYAYDGVNWNQLSTVCGGTDGRIAWAGPDEFWTIADQRPGQLTPPGVSLADISLCHFQNGQVVGSYAMPVDQPDSYESMDAAACRGPNDCWFGGAVVPAPATGAFHLHWDGTNVTEVTSPADHAVADMAVLGTTQLFESVTLEPGDDGNGEDPSAPAVLHTIAVPGSSTVFRNVVPSDSSCASQPICPPLPSYGTDGTAQAVAPTSLQGLRLSSDTSPSGSFTGSPQLWAVAAPSDEKVATGTGAPHPIALRFSGGAWTQVVPQLGAFPTGTSPVDVAADPGAAAAWVSLNADTDTGPVAQVARLSASGAVSAPVKLGTDQGVGPRGAAGPIACPATDDCWAATSTGWLFHLTDGTQLAQDTDPAFGSVISFRPADGGVPLVLPDDAPPDDSLLNQAPPVIAPAGPTTSGGGDGDGTSKTKTKVKPLVLHSRSGLLKGTTTLRFTFTLSAVARVQVIASRRGKVVARSKATILRAGAHHIDLKLNAKRWPTKLNLKASPARLPAKKKPAASKKKPAASKKKPAAKH